MMASSLTTTLGVVLVSLVSVRAQTGNPFAPCYFPGLPDHVLAPNYFPCIIVETPYAACCQAGWTCYSNALCIATTPSNDYPDLPIGNVTRTACTSPFWSSSECGSICLDEDNRTGELVYCGDDYFCCEPDYLSGKCVCGTNGNATSIAPGNARTVIFQSSTPTGTPTINLVAATTSSPPTTNRTSTTASTVRTTSTTAGPTPTASGSPGEAVTGPDTKGRTIGLAVGIPLGFLALAALGFLLWRKLRGDNDSEPGIINISGEMGSGTAGTGSYGAMEPDQELRENDVFGPTWGNDYGGPRRTGL